MWPQIEKDADVWKFKEKKIDSNKLELCQEEKMNTF